MFTGIVQQLGAVQAIEPNEFGIALYVDSKGWGHTPSPGDSIAVNGCCLTATAPGSGADRLRFDVIQQTLQMTTLGGLKVGDPVNLEHAVTPQTMLGGHIVQGHIDGVGVATKVSHGEAESRMRIEPPCELMPCLVEKGSVAVDGVSMTLAGVGDDWFEIALIPTTLEITTLGKLREGERVNLETDYIAKTVVNWMKRMQS